MLCQILPIISLTFFASEKGIGQGLKKAYHNRKSIFIPVFPIMNNSAIQAFIASFTVTDIL